MRYQHAAADRDAETARRLSALVSEPGGVDAQRVSLPLRCLVMTKRLQPRQRGLARSWLAAEGYTQTRP